MQLGFFAIRGVPELSVLTFAELVKPLLKKLVVFSGFHYKILNLTVIKAMLDWWR